MQRLEFSLAGTSSYYSSEMERWNTRTSEEDKAKIISEFQKNLNDYSRSTETGARRISDIKISADPEGMGVSLMSPDGKVLASFSQYWRQDGINHQPIMNLEVYEKKVDPKIPVF
jgi:hypothetical protein